MLLIGFVFLTLVDTSTFVSYKIHNTLFIKKQGNMKTTEKQTNKMSSNGFGFALLLIAIGAVLLLSKLQIIPAAYNDVLLNGPCYCLF